VTDELRAKTERLTVPEKLLMAALEARERSPTFTAEDLVVEAWKLYPDTFGLSGYSAKFPDSNRVLTNIMGTKGMRGKGWLRKVGKKQYRLTSAGLSEGALLIQHDSRELNEGEKTQVNYLRAELDRQTTSALDRLLLTPASQKALDGHPQTVSFNDACGFWDITARSNANTLNTRLADATVLLDRATEILVEKDDMEGLKLVNGNLSKQQVKVLWGLHTEMQTRFKQELDIIRRRTDERGEKRSRPL
jgi:hypothetical protein